MKMIFLIKAFKEPLKSPRRVFQMSNLLIMITFFDFKLYFLHYFQIILFFFILIVKKKFYLKIILNI